jgi:UDP-N-acetylmuramyl tripeptide synthase
LGLGALLLIYVFVNNGIPTHFSSSECAEVQVPLLGDYQRSNAALALALLLELRSSKLLSKS